MCSRVGFFLSMGCFGRMDTTALVNATPEAEPLDQTIHPRGKRSARHGVPGLASAARAAPAAVPAAHGSAELDATVAPRRRSSEDSARGDLLLYLLLGALTWAAWQLSQMGLIKPSSNGSYWLAVTGGSMMLALFVYPLRKYLRVMQRLGKVKWWFWFHLVMGIAGPWLILVHSGFHIGSLNAGVALYSMVIVVCSGIVGRFIYVRIHRGLNGERSSLHELRQRAGFVENDARSRLHFSPRVEARLLAFERRQLHAQPSWTTHLRQVTLLPAQQRLVYLRCVVELRRPLQDLAAKYEWSRSDLARRKRRARRLVDQYLHAVVRVAQYTAYERLFALWHLAHLPFIYLLVISAVVHVIAVHAY
jgi:hypothetical protein